MSLSSIIEKQINNNWNEASSQIGISELVLKEFVLGNAKISILDIEKILQVLHLIIDDKKAQKIETALIVREEEKKDCFKWYAVYWLERKKFEIKKSTYCNYANALKNQIIPVMGNIKFKELNKDILQFFIYKAQSENNIAEKTAKDCVGIIRQIIADGQEDGIIPEFIISKRKLKYKKQELLGESKKIYTESEYKKIIEEILNNINNTKLGILLGIYTGMRIGELCALQFKDIDFQNNTINVTKTLQRIYDPTNDIEPSKIQISTTKTESSTRVIPITKDIATILKGMNTGNENYILTGTTKYTEPRTFRRKYQNFMKKIEIEPLKFHSLRHTFASMNIENGADIKTISEILGHSDINTTLKVYTHTSEKAKQEVVDKFSKMFTKQQKEKIFTKEYKGNICCISKRTGKLEFIGTILEVARFLSVSSEIICKYINERDSHISFYVVPKIEGITHKNGMYMGG